MTKIGIEYSVNRRWLCPVLCSINLLTSRDCTCSQDGAAQRCPTSTTVNFTKFVPLYTEGLWFVQGFSSLVKAQAGDGTLTYHSSRLCHVKTEQPISGHKSARDSREESPRSG